MYIIYTYIYIYIYAYVYVCWPHQMYDVDVRIHHAAVVSLHGLHVTDLPTVSQQFPTDTESLTQPMIMCPIEAAPFHRHTILRSTKPGS